MDHNFAKGLLNLKPSKPRYWVEGRDNVKFSI